MVCSAFAELWSIAFPSCHSIIRVMRIKCKGRGNFFAPRSPHRGPHGGARSRPGNSAGRQGRNLRQTKLRASPAKFPSRAAREYTLAKLNCANRPPHGARIARRMAQKNSRPIGRLLFQCWRTPIFPGRHQPSIFGTNELNFRVRDGNGWTLVVINTNYSLSSGSPDSFLMIPLLSPDCKHFFRDFYTFLPFYHI